jgi:putative inorganic carbon (hco3(-)) transporter
LVNNINNRRDLKLILFALQLCLLIFSSVCILESIIKTNFTASFKILDPDPDSEVFRAAGLAGSATFAGGYLATLLPLVFVQIFITRRKIIKLFIFLLSMMGMLALILTLTRGAWFAFAIAAVCLAFLLYRHQIIKIRYIFAGLFALVILVIIFQGIIFKRTSEGAVNLINRGHLIQTAFNMIKQYPLTGIGLNTYSLEMEKYTSIYVPNSWIYLVHNKYLLIWAETGIFGLISFLWLLWVSFAKLPRLIRSKDPFISILGMGLVGSFIAISIHMNFESYSGGNIVLQFWLIIAMIAGMDGMEGKNLADS